MNSLNLIFVEDVDKGGEPIECGGLFFRGSHSTYVSGHGSIEGRKSLRLLKRRSCSGCQTCWWIMEELSQEPEYLDGILDNVEHGKVYQVMVDSGQDWETGFWETEGFYFKEVKEEK